MNALILLAAGSGNRMRGATDDKVLAPLAGKPALLWSLEAFERSQIVDHLVVVYRDDFQADHIRQLLQPRTLPFSLVAGGRERMHSVHNALKALPSHCAHVYIHDGARPILHIDILRALSEAVIRDGAAVLAHPVVDTIKRIPQAGQLDKQTLEDLDRQRLWAMETPQAFRFETIQQAYAQIDARGETITDDTAAVAALGVGTTVVPNPHPNPKLTTPHDIAYVEWLLKHRSLEGA